MSKPPAEPPYKQGDWITPAYAHSLCYAPEGQRVWQATATPMRKEWGWATDGKSGVSAAHFRLATRADITAEIDRVAAAIREMSMRHSELYQALVSVKETGADHA